MSINISTSLSDENEGEYEYEYEEMDEDENDFEDFEDENFDEDENEDENDYEDLNEYEEMEGEEEEEEYSSSSSSVVKKTKVKKNRRVEDNSSSSTFDVKTKLKSNSNRKKKFEKTKNLSLSSSSNDDSSYHYNDRFYSPRMDDDSSGGNYFSAEGNTKEDLDRFFGLDHQKKMKNRVHAKWQSSEDSFEPVDEINFRGIRTGDNHMMHRSNYKRNYQDMEEKSMYLRSRIRNLKRLLEKGGLDPAVEAVELKKIKRLEKKLRELDLKLNNKTYNYESHLDDFQNKLKAMRKMKSKHKDVLHALRQVRYERDIKGVSNNKKKNILNQKRVYIENKIKNLGGFVSEDSEYSVGSWDSLEEDRGKEGTFFLVVDRPSALDVPKEKERNGVVIYNPNEGEPIVRKFKGIKQLQNEIDKMFEELGKLEKIRKRKGLKKTERQYIDDRIKALMNRVDKLKELQNAKINPENVSKHKRLGDLYLNYFDTSDKIAKAKYDKMDPEYIKRLLRKKKKIRDEIIQLENELASSFNKDQDDSSHEEIEEKWKLVDEAKDKFARAPKFYTDPYTVNDMLGEAKKLEIKAEKLWNEEPHTRENRYRVRRNIGRILNIFDDLNSLNYPRYPRSGYNMYHPNIDIENYYPWDGRYSRWSKNGSSFHDPNFPGKGRPLNDKDKISGISFEMDDRFFRNGLPLIYDKNLRNSHYGYQQSKLLHYGPLTNSNGNKDLVFLFDDRLICTRVNTLNNARFHFKNEILLSTGELKVVKDAERHDESSFLPQYREKKRNKNKNNSQQNNVHTKKINESVSIKDDPQLEQELIDMEDDNHKSSSVSFNKKGNKKSFHSSFTEPSETTEKKSRKPSKHRRESSDNSSSSDDNNRQSSSDDNDPSDFSDDSEEIDYHCFFVGNGRKGKFFYAKSKSEMNFWVKKIQTLVDKQDKAKLND